MIWERRNFQGGKLWSTIMGGALQAGNTTRTPDSDSIMEDGTLLSSASYTGYIYKSRWRVDPLFGMEMDMDEYLERWRAALTMADRSVCGFTTVRCFRSIWANEEWDISVFTLVIFSSLLPLCVVSSELSSRKVLISVMKCCVMGGWWRHSSHVFEGMGKLRIDHSVRLAPIF